MGRPDLEAGGQEELTGTRQADDVPTTSGGLLGEAHDGHFLTKKNSRLWQLENQLPPNVYIL
jgi:hypothetical protein